MIRSLPPRSANSPLMAGHRRRGAWIIVGVAAAGVIVAAVRPGDARSGASAIGSPATVRAGWQETPVDSAPRTWLEMKNVHLRVADNAVVGVRELRGEVIPTERGGSALLDSTRSFSIRITSGTVALASADLGVILNRFVFGYKGSPLKNLRVRMSGDQLVQTGTMHKGVDLKFEIKAALSLTDSGMIRLHPTKVRVLGVNGESLLHALGLRLDDMLDLSKSTAAR